MLAGLGIYFIPMIVPPLGRLSVFNLLLIKSIKHHSLLSWLAAQLKVGWPFILFVLTGSTAAVVLSCTAVRRDWRLAVNKRLIFWLLGGLLLILWGSMAYQLGSNLTCEGQYRIAYAGCYVSALDAVIPNGCSKASDSAPNGSDIICTWLWSYPKCRCDYARPATNTHSVRKKGHRQKSIRWTVDIYTDTC